MKIARLPVETTGNDMYVATVIENPAKGSITNHGKRRTPHVARVRRWSQRSFSALLATLVISTLSLATAPSASANWFGDAIRKVACPQTTWNQDATPARSGVSLLLTGGTPVESGWMDETHTGFEMFGMSGQWTVYRGGESSDDLQGRAPLLNPASSDIRSEESTNECVPALPVVGNFAANMILSASKATVGVSEWVLQNAFQPDWITSLNHKAADVVTGVDGQPGLRDALYFPFLELMIVLAALYLFWQGVVKRRSTQATSSALWMVGAVIVGSLFVYNPALLPDATTRIIGDVSAGVLSATAGSTIDGKAPEGSLCATDALSNPTVDETRDQVIRTVQCNMWESFVYVPYAIGQWGEVEPVVGNPDTQPTVNLGGGHEVSGWAIAQLKATTVTPDQVGLGATASAERKTEWNAVVDAVATTGTAQQVDAWRGYDYAGRIAIAVAAFAAAVCSAVIVITLGLGLLAQQLAISLLIMSGPLFLLLGVHPGMGKSIALKWAEMVVGALLKSLMLVTLLSMSITMLGLILRDSSSSFGTSFIGLIAMTVAIMIYRKQFLKAVSPNFGGSTMLSPEPMQRAGQVLKGAAGGAVVGGAAGVVAGRAGKAAGSTALNRVASNTTLRAGAVMKGAGKGAMDGARRANGGPAASVTGAWGAGKQAAAAHAAKSGSALGSTQPQRETEDVSPAVYASQRREEDRAEAKYMADWEKHHAEADGEWNQRFTSTYGFAPVNPYESTFPGYGKPRAALTPDLMPRPIRPESVDAVKTRESSREPQSAVPASRMLVPQERAPQVVPTRPVKRSKTEGGSHRPQHP